MAWLHLWLGLASGMVVFIVSLTGCLYVFHEEFLEWFPVKADQPAVMKDVRATGRPFLKPSAIVTQLQQQMDQNEAPIQAFMIRYFVDKPSLLLAEADGVDERIWYTFDPYTGELLDQKLETPYGVFRIRNGEKSRENLRGFEFFPFVLQGHMTLWLSPKVGQPIVAYGTLVFVVLLISGLVLWWPKSKAAAKQRYWFRWKKSTKWRRKNYDLHHVNGFYMFLLLFIIAFTGLCIGLGWMRDGMHFLLGGGEELEFKSVPPKDGDSVVPQHYVLDAIFEKETNLYPDADTRSMYWAYPSLKDAEATTMTVTYTEKTTYRAHYDRYSQRNLGFEDEANHDDESLAHRMEELYLPLHEGSVGGLPTKVLAFVASLISTSLPVTGFYIWWGRRNKTARKKAKHHASVGS